MAAQDQPGDVYQYILDQNTGLSAFSDLTQTGNDLFANNACQTIVCGTVAFVAAAPEPSMLLLLAAGFTSLLGVRRRMVT